MPCSNGRGMANVAPLGYHRLQQGDAMPETSIQTLPGFSDLSKVAEERLRHYREDPSSTVPAFDAMVQRALKDSDECRTISNEEMHRRIETWQK